MSDGMTEDETRVLLVKPGDLLLIGGVEVTPEGAQMVSDAFRALELHAIAFSGDIEIGKLTPEQLRAELDASEREERRRG